MKYHKTQLFFLAFIAALGGFLFGYDTAVISGTISMVVRQYDLSTAMEGWYVSSALIGCISGVAVAGWMSDRFGRRPVLMLSAVLFSVSAVGCALADSFAGLIAYRIIGGVGVGVASMVSPMYISEISPPQVRGSLVTNYQFAITLGILCSYFVNAWLLGTSEHLSLSHHPVLHHVFVADPWRGMLGSESVVALLFLTLLLFVPRSPRWLMTRGRYQEALGTMTRIMSKEDAERSLEEVKKSLEKKKGSMRMLLAPGLRLAVLLGVCLSFLGQFSGINAIIYYGPKILEEAGLSLSDALGGQVVIGLVNVVFTLVAIWKIDQLGRKPLLLAGVTGIVISLVIIGGLFYFNLTSGWLLLAFILLFIASFAFSLGPVVWVVISEIYPTRVRGRAMSIAVMATWIGTAVVGQIVPMLLGLVGAPGTFWFFVMISVPLFLIVWRVLPETKNRSLEDIERYWDS
jgi:sugar porter (SP) family MFS transporter